MMTEPLLDLGLLDKADMTGQHETPTTSVSCRNPWLEPNGRVNRTPEGPFDSLCNVRNSTFSTRCERKKAVLHRRSELSAVRQLKYGKTRLTSKITGKEENEYFSEEGSQRLKRQHRFVDDNCTGSSRDNTTRKEEDPYETIKWMKDELNHYRTLGEFHKNSSENHFQEQNFLQANNVALKLELTEREQQLKAILAENLTLKKSIADLHVRLETTNLEKETALTVGVTEKVKTVLNPYFTEGQIRCLLENKKWVKWSVDDYASAISFRSISPKAYRYFRLKLHFPLPSLASLRRWALKKFDVYEGFLMDVLAIMKQKSADLSEMMKITVLTFDEMAVSDEVRFDSKLQKLIGPCSKVQVIMVRGLFGNWKQPIYYKFDQPMKKNILDDALTLLHNAGYQVVACTSDMGNKGVWGELKITPEKHYFQHASIKDAKVFVFADVPHLLKLLRNWFIDDGFTLSNCKKTFTSQVYEEIVKMGNSGDLRIAHKITQQLLNARQNLRQSVHPAAKLWSHTAAKAIKWAGDHQLLKEVEYLKYSDFVLAVNNWFDVHNSQTKYGTHPGVNGYGMDLEKQEQILSLMTLHMESMRVGRRTKMMPFQEGIIISNASLRALHDYLKIKFPQDFQYIITRRLQQDILENFFSYIRGMGATNDSPSGYDFRYRLRWYVLGKHSQALFTMNRNTEEDLNATCMSSLSSAGTSHTAEQPTSRYVQSAQTTSTSTSVKNMTLSTPNSELRLNSFNENFTDATVVEDNFKCADDNLQEEITLTQELFKNIINITCDELLEDSVHERDNNRSDNLEILDDDVCENENEENDLWNFMQCGFKIQHQEKEPVSCTNSSDIVQTAGLQYVAGYVAHRFISKYPFLGERTINITDNSRTEECDWVKTVSKGYLIHPSEELMNLSKVVDECFVAFHGEGFSTEDYVIRKVVSLVKNSGYDSNWVPEEVLQCLVRTRTYIRVNEINKRENIRKKEKRKTKKLKKMNVLPAKRKRNLVYSRKNNVQYI
ncbi:uncharacterized protein [Temnothorax longispinosus]|uniref:uncharacterized protein n=1 Tax=Temnothorax longispinosus TaxID=300112 RepID=UPI003A998CD0